MEMPKLMIQMETRKAPPGVISLRADGTAQQTKMHNAWNALFALAGRRSTSPANKNAQARPRKTWATKCQHAP